MKRSIYAVVALLLGAMAAPAAHAQSEIQALVDRSTLALEEMLAPSSSDQAAKMLQNARAVMICPRIFEAGFIVGGSGGQCVLVARAANGTWSYPAFYGIGSASVGLQLGLKDSELVLLVMTDKGLTALLESHFKFGGDASAVVATIGGGVQGATTTAAGADIVGFTKSRGAFAGLSLQGSVLTSKLGWDQAYYGRAEDAAGIVLRMEVSNPGAEPLRGLLTRYGSGQGPAAAGTSAPSPMAAQAGGAPGPVSLAPTAPVQQQNLPPPAR
ncbi:MAG: hypothetical protein KGI51_03035 [Rhodospirillales bacterium]|nr:hypothetical protein [Rhodospirillales bacterium]